MNNFIFENKTKVYFGKGGVKEYLGSLLVNYGETVMLAYGGGSIKRNGVYDEIMGILNAAGKRVVEFDRIMPNPTYAKAQEGAKLARENHVDLILAVGGGSVSDCCKVISAQDCGTHTLFIAEVTEAKVLSDERSVTYAYYFDHIKPKPIPTGEKKKGYVCKICGYIYEGDELPEDFICPLCKHGAADFEPIK